jgi:hypothetical protein
MKMSNPDPIRPRGEDTVTALRDWAKDELKGGPARAYDLGKFFFTVSTGTAGLVTGVIKLGTPNSYPKSLIYSLVVFGMSILVTLNMVRPRVWTLGDSTDLINEHERTIKLAVRRMWVWFGLWAIGLAFGFYAIFNSH